MIRQQPLRTFMYLVFDVDSSLIADKQALIDECSKCYPHLFCKDFLVGSVIAVMQGTPSQLDALVNEIQVTGFMAESTNYGQLFPPATFEGISDAVCVAYEVFP